MPRSFAAPDVHADSHQAGIATRQQTHVVLTAHDLVATADPWEALRAWGANARRLMAEHTGDELTVTIGVGPALFGRAAHDADRPVALQPLPSFPRDALDARFCGGGLCVQACAEDVSVAEAAAAEVAAAAGPVAGTRWTQRGTMPRRSPSGRPMSPRSAWGFIEGTRNLRRTADLDRHVWAGRGDRPWMRGGTYLVVRRIRLLADQWDALGSARQQDAMGSDRATGVPLQLAGSHVDLASRAVNGGVAMLRRSYNLTDERGLLFLAYMRDPRRQFVPIQRRLDEHDPLARTAVHTGSAVFALPPAGALGGA